MSALSSPNIAIEPIGLVRVAGPIWTGPQEQPKKRAGPCYEETKIRE